MNVSLRNLFGLCAVAAVVAVACVEVPPESEFACRRCRDASVRGDSGRVQEADANAPDVGFDDAEAPDNGVRDIGVLDTGPRDTGVRPDAGSRDAEVDDLGIAPSCDDVFEPNQERASAPAISVMTHANLTVCHGNRDWYSVIASVNQSFTITVLFSHAEGDIDVSLYDPTGATLDTSAGTVDNEVIQFQASTAGRYAIEVYLYTDTGPVFGNTYDLEVAVP